MSLLALTGFWAPGHQRPNFDSFIYIHYAVPPYSPRISAIYLFPFGKVWLGSVCRVQRLATNKCNSFWPQFLGGATPTFLLQNC